jgi:hypothetical protein
MLRQLFTDAPAPDFAEAGEGAPSDDSTIAGDAGLDDSRHQIFSRAAKLYSLKVV